MYKEFLMKTKNLSWLPAIALVFALTIIACGDGGGGGGGGRHNPTPGGDPALAGTISITPAGPVTIGTELTAVYSGDETVSYQWKRGGSNVSGATSTTYTPDQAGSYTVTVSASGYTSKTSAAVTVTPGGGQPGEEGTPGLAYTLINDGTAYSVRAGTAGTGAVVIPASYNDLPVTEIGMYAFRNRTGLTSITIPSSVTSIGDQAFDSCTNLASVTIPSSVTSIGDFAFSACTGLTSVTIPAGVTSIGSGTFAGCTGLTGITVAASNPNYASEGGILYNKAKTTLIQAPIAGISGAFTIPSSVTSIGDGAFWSCESLTSITIPSSVTSIGMMAFYECTSLTSVTISAGVTSIGGCAFYMCTSLTSVTIPSSVTSIYANAFYSCTGLTSITIPASVTYVGVFAFMLWTSTQTINVQGKADHEATNTVGWHWQWNDGCNATIIYNAP
jgi:hypothetical protein